MQFNTKNTILVLLLGFSSICFYYGFRGEDTPRETAIQKPIASAEPVQTHAEKKAEIVVNSGTDWGMASSGSGTPITEIEEEKPKFQKPNTQWKTRTISGVTYVFGEGNPVGAKPLSDEEKDAYNQCYYNTVVHDMDCPLPVSMVGYVTADVERELLSLITDSNWEKVLTNCEQQFRQYEDVSSTNDTSITGFVSYDTMVDGTAMSLENLIFVEEDTGRKRLGLPMRDWLRRPLLAGTSGDFVDIQTLDNCITQNGGRELARKMDTLNQKLYYPNGNYPARLTDKIQYVPLY